MSEVKLNDTGDRLREIYPSNSRVATPVSKPTVKKEPVKSVVQGKTSLQKQSLSDKIKRAIFPGDIKDIKSYAWNQLIIPGLKSGALALFEMALFGQVRRTARPGQTNYSYISTNGGTQGRSQVLSQRDRSTHNFQNIIFSTYQDAEEVIGTMIDIADRYGSVTVADFYSLCGQEPDWASQDWGWKGFQKLESKAIAGGYIIDVQPPIMLR